MADPVNDSAPEGGAAGPGGLGGLWRRQRMTYPDTGTRATYLTILIIGTIVLYYELYIAGAVAPRIISGDAPDGMTFPVYLYITVAANALGAFGSLAAGLADRWGRANLVAYGLLATGSLTLFGIPNASGTWGFAVIFAIIGYIGGIVLVATPALVRDYTQQLGRSTAMGVWALGPVIGSLAVAVVSSNTLPHLHPWQDQFVICGIVALAVGLVAVIGLRELSPQLRDEFTRSLRERALAEARAREGAAALLAAAETPRPGSAGYRPAADGSRTGPRPDVRGDGLRVAARVGVRQGRRPAGHAADAVR
ncbi:MAG TPA: MFS transporter, partial [Trebonia sp.]|nr:MFS transporter [Trebonia sp.]